MYPPFKYGRNSKRVLDSLAPRLQMVMLEAIKTYDFSLLEGYRTEVKQNEAFRTGRSTKKFPKSKHNQFPSLAVDCAPYPIDWKDEERFCVMAGHILSAAIRLEVPIRWGGNWDSDNSLTDERFRDYGHFELDE